MPGRRGTDSWARFTPWLLAFIAAYIGFMLWSDRNYQLGERLAQAGWVLAGLLPLIVASFLLRYARWRLFLNHTGRHTGVVAGLVAYLAGFALTASPGKAGELVRARYFSRLGTPAELTVAAFVSERACDLVVVLGLSLLIASQVPTFGLLAGAIGAIVTVIIALSKAPRKLRAIRRTLAARLPRTLSRPVTVVLGGAARLGPMLTWKNALPGLAIGIVAWLLPSIAFVILCMSIGLELPLAAALGLYPAAMLIGALSLIPGGIGTTEAATVMLLVGMGAPLPEALVAAIGIRLATLWFATLLGTGCLLTLEIGNHRTDSGDDPHLRQPS